VRVTQVEKFEARNSKSETNPNDQMIETKKISDRGQNGFGIIFLNIRVCFEFRYSNFGFPLHRFYPKGWQEKTPE
jgi:hypothetical protein